MYIKMKVIFIIYNYIVYIFVYVKKKLMYWIIVDNFMYYYFIIVDIKIFIILIKKL